ncbi:hypothetical protein DF186_14515, partial [Enterococcus hirae]
MAGLSGQFQLLVSQMQVFRFLVIVYLEEVVQGLYFQILLLFTGSSERCSVRIGIGSEGCFGIVYMVFEVGVWVRILKEVLKALLQ